MIDTMDILEFIAVYLAILASFTVTFAVYNIIK